MTDKEKIIIDGIDVSECGFLWKEKLPKKFCNNGNLDCDCNSNPNCYFKQLKRKEQALDEIEDIADDYNRVEKTSQYYRDGFDQIQDIINNIKEQ